MYLTVKFEGGLAEQHKIPAYDGTKSLEGLTRSILIVSNFLVEGRVRRREFGNVPLTFNLVAQQPGSFESIFEVAYGAAVMGGPVVGGLAAGVAGNLLTDLLKVVYQRVCGTAHEEVPQRVLDLEAQRPGDVAALVEAAEPAIRLGHNVINHGVININIQQATNAAPQQLAELTPATKAYVWENAINNGVRLKLFSIGSFNANQGTGRAFDLEEGRSIPFELMSDADRQTIETLLASISQYTRRRRLGDNLASAVALQYTSVDALDGRIKKIRILKARTDMNQI
ncbi:putative transcriptional regulator [Neorhizobium galegae]|uniref:DUF7946 domain-containing protein n=1 Tax=Neorhizobium galegae TaxID=399 RepID=UPI0027881621|nr:hypothetical protein [Neorhizobium galegae]MDQ0134014.1 putative transcriptional regulator [Neorhizobium galegae]